MGVTNLHLFEWINGMPEQFYKESFKSELSFRNKLGRLIWGWTWVLLFRPSPRVAFAWRRSLLRVFGAVLASDARIYPDVKVYAPWNLEMRRGSVLGDGVNCYNVDKVLFEEESNVTHFTFICTAAHELDSPTRDLVTAPVRFGVGCWVFAHAIILPGVEIGRGGVVASGAVVTKSVPEYHVVGGNPAIQISERIAVDRIS
jgi:putative colanic acid biosynthesis acetyltransferase WcaF